MKSLLHPSKDELSAYLSIVENLKSVHIDSDTDDFKVKKYDDCFFSPPKFNDSTLIDSSCTTDSTSASTPDDSIRNIFCKQQNNRRGDRYPSSSSSTAIADIFSNDLPSIFEDSNDLMMFNAHQKQTLINNGIISAGSLLSPPGFKGNNIYSQTAVRIRPWLQFGGFGSTNSNFTEPNSVVLSPQGHIIIADTNSHHIKLFDGEGRFLYKFGDAGKSYGKLLYPCKIDILPRTNRLVIVQRNPMPQIQIFSLNGQYETRFAGSILKFPRAMCVDEMGCIIIIESKVMTCHIFSPDGRYLRKLHLQNDLSFPFDICANGGEIFISDNQAHCVKVFDYNGKLRRKIGEGVVKFPVCLDYCAVKKSIFITDNHERFNVNQFSLSASKDFRIYRYKLPDGYATKQHRNDL
ncbi:hypothetical protein GJ496_002248 [Pomphorhynchus laevis]|nr:hypothetical protein GJ496_002248 [Pomphorhynchus laevis]